MGAVASFGAHLTGFRRVFEYLDGVACHGFSIADFAEVARDAVFDDFADAARGRA